MNGPYEFLDESHMDNHILIDHFLGATPLNNIIPYLSDGLLLNISSTWWQGINISCLKKLKEFMQAGGVGSSNEET